HSSHINDAGLLLWCGCGSTRWLGGRRLGYRSLRWRSSGSRFDSRSRASAGHLHGVVTLDDIVSNIGGRIDVGQLSCLRRRVENQREVFFFAVLLNQWCQLGTNPVEDLVPQLVELFLGVFLRPLEIGGFRFDAFGQPCPRFLVQSRGLTFQLLLQSLYFFLLLS